MQYHEYKQQAQELLGGKAVQVDGQTIAAVGAHSDPTAAAAAKRLKLLEACDKIDVAAQHADPFNAKLIREAVTDGLSFERAAARGYIGSRAQFFRARRKFFWALDQLL